MIFETQAWFRAVILGFAALVGLVATWVVLPEIARLPFASPDGAATSDATTAAQNAARTAARLGVIRGDLWANLALTYGGLDRASGRGGTQTYAQHAAETARVFAERALSYSPHDARVWLFLVALDTQVPPYDRHAAAALKMSYYTGPYELGLIPLRLLVAVRPGILADEELRQLFRHELQVALGRRAELKPAIVAAHRVADPAARRLIEEVISEQDPELLASLRANPVR
jgi:hypothetical protein